MTAQVQLQNTTLDAAGASFENYARRAEPVIAHHALWWASLAQSAARAGIEPAQLLGDLAAENDRQLERARRWKAAIVALDTGAADLVPWRYDNSQQIRLAVVRKGASPLGWGVIGVLVVAAGVVLAGAAVYLIDAWLATKQTEADARRLDAQTRAQLAKVAGKDPQVAAGIAQAMAEAEKAAAAGGPDWLDRLTGAGAAGLGGAAFAFALFYLLSSRRGRA